MKNELGLWTSLLSLCLRLSSAAEGCKRSFGMVRGGGRGGGLARGLLLWARTSDGHTDGSQHFLIGDVNSPYSTQQCTGVSHLGSGKNRSWGAGSGAQISTKTISRDYYNKEL